MEWRLGRSLKSKGWMGRGWKKLTYTYYNLAVITNQRTSEASPSWTQQDDQNQRWKLGPMLVQEARKLLENRKVEHTRLSHWGSCKSGGDEWPWNPRATKGLPRAPKRPRRSHLPQESFNVDKAAPLQKEMPHRTSSSKGREGYKASKSQLTLLEPDQETASLEFS